jgi:hypothetical protein
MITVRIEHRVSSFQAWKRAFDRDPADRKGSGVRRYAVMQPVDDPNYVLIDLDFDDAGQADAFLSRMRRVWASSDAAPALGGPPRVAVVSAVDTATIERT